LPETSINTKGIAATLNEDVVENNSADIGIASTIVGKYFIQTLAKVNEL